jgi:hypothetical protein
VKVVFQAREQFIVCDDHHILETVREKAEVITLFLRFELIRFAHKNKSPWTYHLQFDSVFVLDKRSNMVEAK